LEADNGQDRTQNQGERSQCDGISHKGKSGREGDWRLTGFSPRKQNLTLYLIGGFDTHIELLQKLGKFTPGVSNWGRTKLTHLNTL